MIPLNSFGNCTTDTIGTGSRSCDLKSFGDVTGPILFKKGWNMTVATATLSEAIYRALISAFTAFPLLGIRDFAQNTPENEKNTSALGVMTEIRSGKPQFSFMFDKGGCFHKALYDKRGKGRWDLGIVFENGILLATNTDKTKLQGFDMGLFSVETFKLLQGSDPEMSTAMIQLLDAMEFNTLFVFLTWDVLGFNINKIDGVVEGQLLYAEVPGPGTEFSLLLASACNADDIILDMDVVGNWELGGTQATPTAITAVAFNAGTMAYNFTVAPALVAGDTIQPKLVGAGGVSVAEDTLGNMFKAIAKLATL